jgi:hypothetical protein
MDKNKFTEIVNDSLTITEVIIKMGLRAAGGNYKSIRNKIEKYEIDTSHFISDEIRKQKFLEMIKNGRKETKDILVENSTYNRGHLKDRLYNEGLKQRCCELCGQGEEWMGKKMSLILD